MVYYALPIAARKALKKLMASGNYEYQSHFAKKYVAKGEAKGEARALLTVLEARGLTLSDEARARVAACLDTAQLEQWVRRAVTIASVDELFE